MSLLSVRTLALAVLLAVSCRADDSILEDSLTPTTSVSRSWLTGSNLTDSRTELARLLQSTAQSSTVLYSLVSGSSLDNAVLNATFVDQSLGAISTKDAFTRLDHFYFNRVYDSDIKRSTIGYSPECRGNLHTNSTVTKSQINSSTVQSSILTSSKLNDNTISCNSILTASDIRQGTKVFNSDVSRTDATSTELFNSRTEQGKSINSKISNSEIKRSNVFNSGVMDSYLEEATSDHSNLSNSVVKRSEALKSSFFNSNADGNSKVQESELMNSNIENKSVVTASKISNSNIANSQIQNCMLVNSFVNGQTLNGIVMMNNMIVSRH